MSSASPEESAADALWELVRHLFLITAAFLAIFSFAIGINELVKLGISYKVIEEGTFLYWTLVSAKGAILLADLYLLAVLTYKYVQRASGRF